MNIKYDTTSPSCLVWLKGRRAGAVAGTKKAKQGLLPCAGVYLNSKFVILTRQGPSPSARPSAPIGGAWRQFRGGGHC